MERARTDLALEARNEYMEKYARVHKGEADGVTFCERSENGVKISEIEILSEEGARAVGRDVENTSLLNSAISPRRITALFPRSALSARASFARLWAEQKARSSAA